MSSAPAEIAAAITTLGAFCGERDIAAPTPAALREATGLDRVDAVLCFGGSILAGARVFAEALGSGVAATSMLVGGEGHTTAALRGQAAALLSGDMAAATEAEIFDLVLRERHGVHADLLETRSTNCGDNITRALALLAAHGIRPESVLLIQDATMQRRMGAVVRRDTPATTVVAYASYAPPAVAASADGALAFVDPPDGMWPLDRYASMLLGEIGRLRDDDAGYGPRGRGWIAHVDIPPAVEDAAALLAACPRFAARVADARWASAD
ncbi:MAG: ElyC/SanA/YdcF family protein [Microbacterium sp.]|uniref:ElyC/SanA/YdcF family protein n=1 Tax=Microbacterium sp. TaxID=51671 RepID=UPI0039E28D87